MALLDGYALTLANARHPKTEQIGAKPYVVFLDLLYFVQLIHCF